MRFGFDIPEHAALVELGPEHEVPGELDPAEEALLHPRATASRIRDFRRGRHAAHLALRRLGRDDGPILRGSHRQPIWPSGIVGSVTHTEGHVIAVVALEEHAGGVGVDVEVRSRAFPELSSQVAHGLERRRLDALPANERVDATLELFAAKEAIYKALFPRVGRYFGFDAVQLEPGPKGTLAGRVVSPVVAPHAPHSPLHVQVRWSGDAVGTLLFLPPLL